MQGILSDLHHRASRPAMRCSVASAVLVLAISFGGCGSSSDDAPEAGSPTPPSASTSTVPPVGVELLGVLSADGGTFADGKLTLTDVDPRGVWFTDRPARRAGTEGIDAFTERFFAGDDPPNAVVEVTGAPSSKNLAVVELSDPAYDAKAGTVTFTAKLVPAGGSKTSVAARVARHPGIAEAVTRQDGALPATFGAATVFLDDAPAAPVNQELQELAAEDARLQPIYFNAENVLRTAVNRYGRDCMQDYLNEIVSVYVSVAGDVPRDLAKLQADAARNGGQIPSSDQALLSSVEEQLDGASQTAEPLPGLLARVERGQCPFR